jgi:hypothetical protein
MLSSFLGVLLILLSSINYKTYKNTSSVVSFVNEMPVFNKLKQAIRQKITPSFLPYPQS